MKKTFIIFTLFILVFITSSSVSASAKSKMDFDVRTFVEEYSSVEPSWSNVKIKRGEPIHGFKDKEIGYIFRLYKKNEQHGYIIYLDHIGVVEAAFSGKDDAAAINGKLYYTPGGFVTKKDFNDLYNESSTYEISQGKIDGATGKHWFIIPFTSIATSVGYNYSASSLVNLSSNVSTYVSPYVYKEWIINVPDYHQSYNSLDFSCAPTSATMLIAYYDNEYNDSFTDQEGTGVNDSFPLQHLDSNSIPYYQINALTYALSYYMDGCYDETTCTEYEGTFRYMTAIGIEDFIENNTSNSYTVIQDDFESSWSEYETMIGLGHPTIIHMPGHAVTGVGYYRAYQSPSGAITQDTAYGTTQYKWYSYDIIEDFTFINLNS